MRTRLLPLVVLGPLLLSACSAGVGAGAGAPGDRLDVVAGFYPYAFVAEQVGGNEVAVTNLTAPGAEPHDLELSPQQVAELSGADLVLYSPGFQPAVDEAVDQQASDRAFDVRSAVELRAGDDPHVWLDPVRLAEVADAVAEQLAERAPDRADVFRERADALTVELSDLDGDLEQGLASCARKDMVTSHDAFGYLADRYGLEQVAIGGLSPEDEPSPRRLAEVAQLAQERGVTTIFFEELVSPRVAESLAREVGADAQVLTPLEGPPDDGDYVSAMRANLDTLRTALECA